MLYEPLAVCDPEIANLIELERERQFDGLELIASEVISVYFMLFFMGNLELYFYCRYGGQWIDSHQ